MLVYIKPLSMFPDLHSDRLFGALFSAINEIFSDKNYLEDMKHDFIEGNPPFIISSAFPSINLGNKNIRFFPKLILNKQSNKSFNSDVLKDFKKVNYFEERIFVEVINGHLNEDEILDNYFDNYKRINNLLTIKNRELNATIKNVIRPSNAINRLNNKTEIFYTDGMRYSDNYELFFFIDFYDENYEKIIKSALRFLKDRGFGKDIFTGKGHFDYRIEDINFSDLISSNSGNRFVTLSRFIPHDNETNNMDDLSCYELNFKRSRDKSGEVRKQVRFFNEGSTFNCYSEKYGCVVESGENYPAIEYGYAFPVKYTQKGD